MLVKDPNQRTEILPETATQIFGLTPAEARLAIELSSGQTLEEIAEKQEINVSTVRAHLKKIFQKTDTNRQAELVRLLLSIPDIYGR